MGLGRGRYLKKKVQDAIVKETQLHNKIHKFQNWKRKGKKQYGAGRWVRKKTASAKDVKEYLKIKRENARKGY